MNNDGLIQIAMYVWEIRKAAKSEALGRKGLEKAIEEIGGLRRRVSRICEGASNSKERGLAATMESLFEVTENDIFDRLVALPSSLYDLSQFANES